MIDTRAALVVVGTGYHAPTAAVLEVLADVAIVVDANGTIEGVYPAGSVEAASEIANALQVVRLTADQRLLPGLVDLHIHAPQWPQVGTGLDLTLERWLFEYTFPLEARYANETFAADVWEHMVPTLLAHGTTTAVYFASVHEPATRLLAEQCVRFGQRAFVGRVAMDHPEGTPDWYRDASAAAGVEASHASVEAVRAIGGTNALVQPIITPRFVPACTDELLAGLGDLASATGALVQTHCSESDWAHSVVFQRFDRSDATVLRDMGLLREGTVLAHGNFLGDDDFDAVRAVGAGVAHCPQSNAYFANAVFPVRHALAKGVKVGMGTDVAGGAHPGLLSQCSMAIAASRMLEDGVDARLAALERGTPGSRIDAVTAFHLATAGGADVLGIPVGRFQVGRQFDAFVVDTAASPSGLRRWDGIDTEERLFEKIVHLAAPADITNVWISARSVAGRDHLVTD
jgi:guanine deaminase